MDVSLEVMCKPGYSATQRHTSRKLKEEVYQEYGIITHKAGEYEIDHLISLELGGQDSAPNLWPQHYSQPNGARDKDKLENTLKDKVCSGQISLSEAQEEIRTNWIQTYQKYRPSSVNHGNVVETVE